MLGNVSVRAPHDIICCCQPSYGKRAARALVGIGYGVFANEEIWTEAQATPNGKIANFMAEDREALSRALGKSYDLPSALIDRGDWLELFQLTIRAQTPIDMNVPLPFSILRAILGELILLEARERSQGAPLPDVQILGPATGDAA